MAALHVRIKADGSHAVVEQHGLVPDIDANGANLIEDDGDTAWFVWEDFEIIGIY
jgi:hypothetical protein